MAAMAGQTVNPTTTDGSMQQMQPGVGSQQQAAVASSADTMAKAKQLHGTVPQLESTIQKFTSYVRQMQSKKQSQGGNLDAGDQANLTKAETSLQSYLIQRQRINQWFQSKGIRIVNNQL